MNTIKEFVKENKKAQKELSDIIDEQRKFENVSNDYFKIIEAHLRNA